MALTYSVLFCLKAFKESGATQEENSILEFGEQNWYGDVEPRQVFDFINAFVRNPEEKTALSNELAQILTDKPDTFDFDVVKIFYKAVFGCHLYRAVDLHGTPIAERHDLNHPLPFSDQFDIVTNIGTAEHVFNVAQFFQTAHEATKPGGFMIHFLPNQGCHDHGFYNFHPTFLFDLAQANRYLLSILVYADGTQNPPALVQIANRADYVRRAIKDELSHYSHLFAILRKTEDGAFQFPQQGYYDNVLPDELRSAWRKLPR